jgi:hypothetical protein
VPSQAEIRCECAFTYMNAVFRKNLTESMAVDANDEDATPDTGGATGSVNQHRAVSPDNRDMVVGRERPPAGRPRGEEGGSQVGVAHAPLSIYPAATTASTATPAAQSAASSGAPNWPTIKDMDGPHFCDRSNDAGDRPAG